MSESTPTPPAQDHPLEQHLQTEPKAPVSEHPELKWTGGCYSRKAFRFRYICVFILTILCVVGAVKWHGANPGLGWALWLAAPVILWIWVLTVAWYLSLTIKYVLEPDRLICKKGLLNQTTDTILVPQMNDIQMKQTLWDKLINGGVGTIVMHTTDTTDPVLTLGGIDKPQDAFDALDTLRKEYVRKRGIKSFGTMTLDEDGGIGAGM